jgi:hypothetical protein
MRVARKKDGQPHPQADKRFLVEAFWVTLDLRFTLASLAQTWLETASNSKASYAAEQRQIWATYVNFILHTCCQDAQIALDVAGRSGSYRQEVKTALYCMRADLELFRFNVHMTQQNGQLKEDRTELAEAAAQKENDAEQRSLSTVENFLGVKGSKEDEQWLEDNFTKISRTMIEEWSAIERSLRCDTFYQPVSLEEQMAVVRALSKNTDFGEYPCSLSEYVPYIDDNNPAHTGHYYRCPNGHLYVIGDVRTPPSSSD